MQFVSLGSMIDQAADRLPFTKRRAVRFCMRRHGPEFEAYLFDKLADEPELAEFVPMLNAVGFGNATQFAIDPDKLERWLALIAKWLPILLALFK